MRRNEPRTYLKAHWHPAPSWVWLLVPVVVALVGLGLLVAGLAFDFSSSP